MSEFVMPSTKEDRDAISGMIKEMSDSMARMEAEKRLQNDIRKRAKAEQGVPPKKMNSWAKTHYKASTEDLERSMTEAEETLHEYEILMGK